MADGNSSLNNGLALLFSRAKLRTTEVAYFARVHRTTVSRWKHNGVSDITTTERKRLTTIIKLSLMALKEGSLPLDKLDIHGKNARLSALAHIFSAQLVNIK